MEEKIKQILVYYISVVGLEQNQIELYFEQLKERIAAESISEVSEIIFVPVYGETRIDCINPKYITNDELIKKHERLMSELHENLETQLEDLKKKNDEQ